MNRFTLRNKKDYCCLQRQEQLFFVRFTFSFFPFFSHFFFFSDSILPHATRVHLCFTASLRLNIIFFCHRSTRSTLTHISVIVVHIFARGKLWVFPFYPWQRRYRAVNTASNLLKIDVYGVYTICQVKVNRMNQINHVIVTKSRTSTMRQQRRNNWFIG